MENGNHQNYDRDTRDFSPNIDTLINKENAIEKDQYQHQEEYIDDVNHQTNDYNRNESDPNGEPILNGEDQITNDEDPESLDNTLEKDGDLDDDDSEDRDNLRDIDEEPDEVSHDPFPSINP
ncbi:hypothetical protein [Flavobacterium chilense]|uniref:Uncharacterized protein n=1 Tax=Flavobacterium chilense TaxID=946677 RepID=A0A1M7F126_9FLAO|nr:hypothetical protein [Flavobacterium chilense]SHL97784.1 hypothetical protein SAMN05444484_103179 [Flavobacterium chilense]